jgi:hypothetical protein
MICRLCLKNEGLLKRSHIIPDFLYQDIFDEKHRLVKFTTLITNSKQSLPNGEYESDILCQNCDNEIIGSLESYASQILFGGKIKVSARNFVKPDGLEFTQVADLDYKKFKLFLLSVLWRASISSRKFFQRVCLGPYEEIVRTMVLTGNPGKSGDFPCVVNTYQKSSLPKEIVAEPKKIRLDGSIGYSFLIGGFLYVFKVIQNEQTDWVLEAAINEKGEMKVIHMPEQHARELLFSYFGVNF